jgi:hypothetical protein
VAPPAVPVPQDPAAQPDKAETTLAPAAEPPPAEAPPQAAPVAAAELTPVGSPALSGMHQGDLPMTRTWKTYGLQALLAATLAAAPPTALTASEGRKSTESGKDTSKRLKNLEEGIKKIQDDVQPLLEDELKSKRLEGKLKDLEDDVKRRLSRLEEDMGKVLATLDALRGGPPRGRAAADPLEDIKARLDRIERTLSRLGAGARIARSPADTGRILLTNNYPEEMLFIIDGRTYRLMPGTSRLLDDRPAGTFTYEVISPTWGSRARKTTTLARDQTFRLTVD